MLLCKGYFSVNDKKFFYRKDFEKLIQLYIIYFTLLSYCDMNYWCYWLEKFNSRKFYYSLCINAYVFTNLSGTYQSQWHIYQSQWHIGSVFALRLGGLGSIPGRVILKTLKIGPNASPHAAPGAGLGKAKSKNHCRTMNQKYMFKK